MPDVNPAEYLWLMQHEKRERERLAKKYEEKRKKRIVTRVRKTGCGTKESDEQLRKRGWTKVACGVWQKKVR
jgi:hypothetical protein